MMKWLAFVFALGGLSFAYGMVELNDHDRERHRQEIAAIQAKGDQALKPGMASLCGSYFEWSKKYEERVQNMERICGEYLTR